MPAPAPTAPRVPVLGDPTRVSTGRLAGFDVARALAVFGMVVVNFRGRMASYDGLLDINVWLMDRMEGRAAALFVLLAGVGVSLRSRKARQIGGSTLFAERKALVRRAGVLFVVGLLNVHIWDWDILHVYGPFLVVAAMLVGASKKRLWAATAAVFLITVAFQVAFPEPVEPPYWTPQGLLHSMVFSGNYPALPWLVFLLVGMWMGRLDLYSAAVRERLLWVSGGITLAAEFLAWTLRTIGEDWPPLWFQWVSTWPRPSGPLYVIAACGAAVFVAMLCVIVADKRARSSGTVALTATGQMALSLYFAHEVAILIPMEHTSLYGMPVEVPMLYSLSFCAAGVAGAVWWRSRWHQGPFEMVLRQVSTRSAPAWGGGLVGAGDRAQLEVSKDDAGLGALGGGPGSARGVEDAGAPAGAPAAVGKDDGG